ncbi:MAG TPA: tetratricopeptide repeat protein [Chloroflexota bacterium]|nr:tetratricopeptide repeat protein [Chloroflexota bacterium]
MRITNETPLGTLLRRYREERGLTQEDLAERAGQGISVSTVSNIERGRTRPYRHTLEALCAALELDTNEREVVLARRTPSSPSPPRPATAVTPVFSPEALSSPLTPLIGRATEEAELVRLLQQDDVRLVTMTGVGGVGKTRLAQAVVAHFSGAVTVSLAALRDTDLLIPALAQALGVREVGGEGLYERLITRLQSGPRLLFLDNFEQILAAGTILADLLRACPGVTVLVTSRAALRVRGEQEFPVRPLALPRSGTEDDPAALARVPAVALFLQRVRAVRPDFELSAEIAPDIAAICIQLDGLPLGIELAAARSRLFPPHALLERLDRRLHLLTVGAKDSPDRQQTLRAAIDWSYSLLSPEEKTVFARLSVFAGGCSLEAAEAVCNRGGQLDLLAAVTGLAEHSLLRLEDDGGPRIGMLATIKEYAADQLEAAGATVALRSDHAEWAVRLVEDTEPHLTGRDQAEWLLRLDREHDNIRAALRWTLESGEVELALRLVSAMWWYWRKRGYLTEGQRWAEGALAQSAGTPEQLRAKALTVAGYLAYLRYDTEQAVAWEEESLAIFRRLGDSRGIALALFGLGNVAIMRGDDAAAEARYREILSLERDPGQLWEVAGALNNLGYVLERRNELEEGEQRAAEGLALFRQLGDLQGVAWTLMTLAQVSRQAGKLARARGRLEEALVLAREIGDRVGTTQIMTDLAIVVCDEGDVERARQLLDESLILARRTEHGGSIAIALLGQGKVAEAQGEIDRAAALYGECLELCRRGGDNVRLAECLLRLARVALAQGSPLRAAELVGAAQTTYPPGLPHDVTADEDIDRLQADIRSAVGAEAFLAAREAGQAAGRGAAWTPLSGDEADRSTGPESTRSG